MGKLPYRLFAGCLAFLILVPSQSLSAQELSVETPTHCCDPVTGICTPGTISSTVTAVTSGGAAQAAGHVPVNLDMSSSARTIAIPQTAQFAPVNINVGTEARTVSPGALLTPAEFVAAHQVLSGGAQSILLGIGGNAVGGSFALNTALSQAIGNLVVPSGVTAVRDFGAASALNIAGNLTNAGSFYAISSNSAVTTAAITASNIMNHQAALISSVLPAGGLPGFTSAASALNLNLNAINNIVNAGTIMSSGSLTATAGGSITNALPHGVTGPAPVMQAMNAVNVQTANLVNSGLIASSLGNVNVAQQTVSNLIVNNQGGTIQALLGSVNVRDAAFLAKSSTSIMGGNVLSREFNINGGEGKVNLELHDVTGLINLQAGEAHFGANSLASGFGTVNVTGDPTFFVLSGPLNLSNISASGPLTIIGPENVTVSSIFHSGGGPVTIGAGINFIQSGGSLLISGYKTTDFNLNVGSITSDSNALRILSSGPITLGTTTFGASSGSSIFLLGARQDNITINGTVTANSGSNVVACEVFTALGTLSASVNISTGNFSGSAFSNPPISGTFTSNQSSLATTFINFAPAMNVTSQVFTGGGGGGGGGGGSGGGSGDSVVVSVQDVPQGTTVVIPTIPVSTVVTAPTPNIIATDQNQLNDGSSWYRWTGETSELIEDSDNTATAGLIPGDSIYIPSGGTPTTIVGQNWFGPSNASRSSSDGYYMIAQDGGVFSFAAPEIGGSGGSVVSKSGGGTGSGSGGAATGAAAGGVSTGATIAGSVGVAAMAAAVADDSAWFIDNQAGSGEAKQWNAASTVWSNVPDEVATTFLSTPENQASTTNPDDLEAKKATLTRFVAYTASEFATAAHTLGAQHPVAVYIPDSADIVSKAVRVVQKMANRTEELPVSLAMSVNRHEAEIVTAQADSSPTVRGIQVAQVPMKSTKRQKNVFLNPLKEDAVVSTKTGYILCKKGAMAFVMDRDRDLAVFALHQTRPGDIKMLVGKKMMTLRPGQEMVVTKRQTDDFELANPGAKIPYRSVVAKDVDGGRKAFRAEFSVPAALTGIEPLKKMLKSADATDRKRARNILKNAVILSQLNPEAGPFKSAR